MAALSPCKHDCAHLHKILPIRPNRMEPRHAHRRDAWVSAALSGLGWWLEPVPGLRYRSTPACGLPALRACYWAVIMHCCAMRKERSWLSYVAIASQSTRIIAEEITRTDWSLGHAFFHSGFVYFGAMLTKNVTIHKKSTHQFAPVRSRAKGSRLKIKT